MLGHEVGDALIMRASSILRANFREEDVMARIGGDEFIALLPDTDEETVQQGLTRTRTQLDVDNAAHPDLPLRLSMGAATARQRVDLPTAQRLADQAMYQEKLTRAERQGGQPGFGTSRSRQ